MTLERILLYETKRQIFIYKNTQMSNTANDTTEIMTLPKLGEKLTEKQIGFLEILAKQCRGDLLRMLINSQSGHPG